jgi:hypothetical protein
MLEVEVEVLRPERPDGGQSLDRPLHGGPIVVLPARGRPPAAAAAGPALKW